MINLLNIFFQAAVINNLVMTQFIGVSTAIDLTNSYRFSFGLGATVTVVTLVAGLFAWLIYHLFLLPLHLTYLITIIFILLVLGLNYLLVNHLKGENEFLKQPVALYLPLASTNSLILGIILINSLLENSFLETVFYTLGAGLGFTAVMIMLTAINESLERVQVPALLQGIPIRLISAGVVSMVFTAFFIYS